MVDLGDGRPVRWGEAREARYMDRANYDQARDLLLSEAAKLEKRERDALSRQSQGQRTEQRPDIADEIQNLALIDGPTMSKLIRQLRTEGFGPLANIVTQLATKIQQLERTQGGLAGATGPLAEAHNQQQFESFIDASFEKAVAAPIKGLPQGVVLDIKDPYVREMAKDVYLSHDQTTWKPGEYEKALRDRVEGAFRMVRAADKKAIEVGEERKRSFFANPNKGNGRASGEGKFKFQKGSELAKMAFGGFETPT